MDEQSNETKGLTEQERIQQKASEPNPTPYQTGAPDPDAKPSFDPNYNPNGIGGAARAGGDVAGTGGGFQSATNDELSTDLAPRRSPERPLTGIDLPKDNRMPGAMPPPSDLDR